MYLAYRNNYNVDIKIARFQNVYGTHDTILGEKERFITAICRKVSQEHEYIEVWGDGTQKRSFIYVQDCIRQIVDLMGSDASEPVNIGTEKQISVNDISKIIIGISGKKLGIKNIYGNEFYDKYGFECPVGIKEKPYFFEGDVSINGLVVTYAWVKNKLYEN